MKQGSAAWHAAREGRLTSSLAAAAAGIHPYTSMHKLWEELRGLRDPFEGNDATAWGQRYEPEARAAYEMWSNNVVEEHGFWTLPNDAWLGASPDGLVSEPSDGGNPLLVEFKCPFSWNGPSRLYEDVKPYHVSQVHVTMAIASARLELPVDRTHYISYVPEDAEGSPDAGCLSVWEINFSPDYWAQLLALCRAFFALYVTGLEPKKRVQRPVMPPVRIRQLAEAIKV